MKYIVNVPRCPLQLNPTHDGEQADEMMLGWGCEILEETAPGWVKVRADYRYEGYAPVECLVADNGWTSRSKKVVTKGYCTVLSLPKVQGGLICDLPRGALVAPIAEPDENHWVKVLLPDGREGYTKESYLGIWYAGHSFSEEEFRQRVCDTAMTYMGAHYRWGGKSPLGIDCSGLAFMSYWLNGVAIYRDAHIRPDFPVREIARADIKKGDLLFFPGHVAVYLGDNMYIHSTGKSGSDGVVLNSLDPAHPLYRQDLDEKMNACGSIF